jgi:hypothetical protein
MVLYCRQMSIWPVSTICITFVPKSYVASFSMYDSSPSAESLQPFEYNFDIFPTWRFVLKHLRWTKRLQAIGDHYLRVIFDVPEHEPIPPVSMDFCFQPSYDLH